MSMRLKSRDLCPRVFNPPRPREETETLSSPQSRQECSVSRTYSNILRKMMLLQQMMMKKIDSYPRTPTKSLVAEKCSSPVTTNFEWIEVEGDDEAAFNKNLDQKINEVVSSEQISKSSDDQDNFLNKVEQLFDDNNEEIEL